MTPFGALLSAYTAPYVTLDGEVTAGVVAVAYGATLTPLGRVTVRVVALPPTVVTQLVRYVVAGLLAAVLVRVTLLSLDIRTACARALLTSDCNCVAASRSCCWRTLRRLASHKTAAKIPTMAMTTRISSSVKPCRAPVNGEERGAGFMGCH